MPTACQCMGRHRHTHTHIQTHQVRTHWAYAMDLQSMVLFNLSDEAGSVLISAEDEETAAQVVICFAKGQLARRRIELSTTPRNLAPWRTSFACVWLCSLTLVLLHYRSYFHQAVRCGWLYLLSCMTLYSGEH